MKKLFAILCLGLLASSCADETTVFEQPEENLMLEPDEGILTGSIQYNNAGVLDIIDNSTGKTQSAKDNAEALAGDYPLTLVAQVDVPSFQGGQNLTASHVDINGDYAYVSYNTVEDGYVGGVDIIDVSDPNSPRLTSRLYYTNADINALKYYNGHLYLAGGVDAERSVTATDNSFLAKLSVNNGRMDLDAGIGYAFQPGYNATDIAIVNNKIYVTSGREGRVVAYDTEQLSVHNEAPFFDLRSVAVNGNVVAVLDAGQGVTLMDDGFNVQGQIPISTDLGKNTKKTIALDGDLLVVSEGEKGAGLYNASTGFSKYIPILLDPDAVSDADVVTNAVALNDGVILMANGGAGLCLSEEDGATTNIVGIIQLEGSINFVASKGDYIFAASGKEGLQIIKMNKPNESLVARCSNLSVYRGSANLNVNTNQKLAYRGAKRFNRLNNSGELLLCGSWTVREG